MDINSLLSPQDSPAPEREQRSLSSGTTSHSSLPTSTPALRSAKQKVSQARAASSPQIPSSPASDISRRLHRQASTSGMDTLADLASMQHHQQVVRANAGGLKNTEPYEAQLSTVNIRPSLQAIARAHSGSRSSLDIRMADAPVQTPPSRVLNAPSLSEADVQRVSQLVEYLAENSHAYDSHVQLVKLLYRGFVSHVFPTSRDVQENEPQSYNLLGDLRQAIEAMSTRFSLGEELWEIKLHVLELTATSLEDCMKLMESFEKASTEETASTRIWSSYGHWLAGLLSALEGADAGGVGQTQPLQMLANFSEEDLLVAHEVFTREQMMQVWARGSEDTKYRIDNSHLVWDKYLDLHVGALTPQATPEEVTAVKSLFRQRLEAPHSTWDNTFQRFSSFISTHDNAHYEEIMVDANRHGAKAKSQFEKRELHETKIRQAADSSDSALEWTLYTEYIDEELSKGPKKHSIDFDLANALYLRTLLRFPSLVDAWENYLGFLADEGAKGIETVSQIPVLGRACEHCPWSGILWSQYILAAELENLPFANIERIKHKATSTGLLDFGGMEEVLKVHCAWCGCLKRQAFQHHSIDDDLDIAEMAIRSAMEDVETLGKTKYGPDYQGDPQYRIERIYIKFLTQNRNYKGARDKWKDLEHRHGSSYEFWLRYYTWEMQVWASGQASGKQPVTHEAPSEATIVLRQAVERSEMDWPEKLIETYLSHCEDHENAAELQTAMLLCRKASMLVQGKRQQEAIEAAEAAQQQQNDSEDTQAPQGSKRKREHDLEADGEQESKKVRAHEGTAAVGAERDAVGDLSILKRDRENATVIVKNLPNDINDKRIRHVFNACGKINSIYITATAKSTNAILEFETKDEALAALTKDQKLCEDHIIEVQQGTGTTLYVTNFPPTADEKYIRGLFDKYGTIVDVRFPSLKYDTHRRFCYLQYQTAVQAHAALALDGLEVGEDLKLSAKISDPTKKQARQGPMHEGREVYIANLDWKADEEDVKGLFSRFGKIEKVRIPRKVSGQSKGIAFVVFPSKDEATAALALDKTEFKSRVLSVETSTPNPSKRQTTTVVNRHTPPPSGDDRNQRNSAEKDADHPGRTSREDIASRTVVILNVPDTVNDTRIKELMQSYGELVKVTLRPDHQGAVVEYKDVQAAGKAAMEIEGHEILPDRLLHVGTFEELKHEKAEIRSGKPISAARKGGEGGKHTQTLQPSMPIRRPVQRTGRRGGLGLKKSSATTTENSQRRGNAGINGSSIAADSNDGEQKGKKNNADFKALFTK